jgi:glycosyltransferase involved in cell wall biosynthesis
MVLDSYARQTVLASDFEVIVVDSSSTDGTETMIQSLKVPYALNYVRVENKGKSFARNQGASWAKAELILLTDADMVPAPDLIAQHLSAHQKYGNCSVEGVTYNLKQELALNELSPEHPAVEPYIEAALQRGQHLKWAYFLSGNLSLRKENFIHAGGFDENFSGYGWEDIELGYRLHKMKVPLMFSPEALNYHFHFVTGQDMLKRKYNMGRSAAYFYKKHPNFEIRMFLGMNPLAMGVFYLLHRFPKLLKMIKNQYILEEYYYRLGIKEA